MFGFDIISPSAQKTLRVFDFEVAWKTSLSPFLKSKIEELPLHYRELTNDEVNQCRVEMQNALQSNLVQSGEHRHGAWVKGWGENAEQLKALGSKDAIVPRYFQKIPGVRWMGRWIMPLSQDFEFRVFEILQYFVFDHYLRDTQTLYEFGCGTGHNLLRARTLNSQMKLVGLDWAESSQEILRTLKEKGIETQIEGHRFDFFHPSWTLPIEPGSDFMTLAALEQTGDRFGEFLDFVLQKKPRRIIHLEPIEELLDSETEIDRYSIAYFHKRNYLRGYLNALRQLERDAKIVIERAERTWVGSFFIEGYSLIVWRPL